MKKIFCNRVLPVMLAVILMFSTIPVQAGAVGVGDESGLDMDSVAAWTSRISNPIADFVNVIAQRFGCSPTGQYVYWHIIDGIIGTLGVGEFTYNELLLLCNHLNSWFIGNTVSDLYSDVIDKSLVYASKTLSACMGLGTVRFEVVEPSPTAGFYRIQDSVSGLWLVNSDGQYPCAPVDGEVTDSSNRWIPEDLFKSPYTLVSIEDLSNMATSVGADIAWNDMYYYIYRDDGCLVYADKNGLPYAAFRDPDAYASQTERPGTSAKDENGEDVELPEDFDANIDLENMLITLPDGTLAILDSVIYDESTKSYYIDSHDTYNTTNNYYYHWEYHINYTSITYIGQTEEYNKYYEVYYELPDGRDSADLTKEDVEQLNVSVDVIPYGRNTDDVSLRSLYHFDGDTRDSSYWNYCTDFTWNEGASLTYMDAGVFEGALYLDEMIHDFTLTLPSNITAGDFTLQFRYYQSHTAAPVTDSYIAFGDETVFQMSGGYFRDGEGNNLYATPVGSWTEIALIRDAGVLYFYLNGVSIGSIADITSYGNTITFHFGDEQQTYKYFDELRVLNEALVTGGDNYAPTSVPHDTNLVLTTPDQVVPVADEYWEIENTPGYLSYLDFSQGVLPSNLVVTSDSTNSTSRITKFPNWVYGTDQVDVEAFDNYTSITRTGNTLAGNTQVTGGIHSVVYVNGPYGGFELGQDYTVTIIYRDGTVEKIPFTFANDKQGYNLQADCRLGQVLLYAPGSSLRYHSLVLNTTLNETVELVGVEVCAGDSSLTAEWVESVTIFDKDALNTPTLAVRTDLDITSYQIGGVRPSVPEKGMVWALVENERITSIQIYNGQAWEGVDGRIWTGSRWIPASSYNIVTLQDMYDIVDATQDYEYIYSESGFWDWWQRTWNFFTERLFGLLETIANPAPATGTVRVKKTITWDGNTEGLVDLDGLGFKVSDEILTVDQLVGGVLMDSSGNKFVLVDSMFYSEGSNLAFPMDSEGSFLALPVIVLSAPFPISDTESRPPGVYFNKSDSGYVASLTYYVEETVVVGGTGSGGSDTSTAPSTVKEAVANALSSLIEGIFGVITEVLKALIQAVTDLLSFLFGFLTDTVLGGISDFFSIFTDGSLLEGFEQSDDEGNVSTGLPDGVGAVFAFFSGLFLLIPAELRLIMIFGIGLMLFLAVFKLVKS